MSLLPLPLSATYIDAEPNTLGFSVTNSYRYAILPLCNFNIFLTIFLLSSSLNYIVTRTDNVFIKVKAILPTSNTQSE
jgi:hypothetical protein